MGALFGGRYELGPLIGSGGSGHVHRGTDHALGRAVAMKVLGREHADDEEARDRFRGEAVLAASVQHANVVPVLDAVEDDGELCLVMEYVDGPTLGQLVRTTPPDVEEALELLQGIAAGLAAAHRAGLVHRDLKPANVLLSAGVPRVADFGLAHALSDGPDPTRTIRGSAGYLAPEQARGEDVSVRTDVYALGCLAVFLLTGAPPFEGDTPLAVVGQHLHATPPDVRERNADVPPHVAEAVRRALAKSPEQRPASAADFAAALGRPLPPAAIDRAPMLDPDAATIGDMPTDPGADSPASAGRAGADGSAGAVGGGSLVDVSNDELRRQASFGNGAPDDTALPSRRAPAWLHHHRRAVAAAAAGLTIGAAAAVPVVRAWNGASAATSDATTSTATPSEVVRLSAQLRQELVAIGSADDRADPRVLGVLAALGRLDAANVRADAVATDAAAREALDLVADMLDDGVLEAATGDALLGLAGRLVSATSTDEAARRSSVEEPSRPAS